MRYESRRRNYLLFAEHVRASPGVRLLTIELEGLLAVLDPDAVVRIDAAAADSGTASALINGSVGLILAPGGKLSRALTFTFTNAKVTQVEVILALDPRTP